MVTQIFVTKLVEMYNPMKKLALTIVIVAVAATTVSAQTQTKWQENHPRRTQVNGRLNNQNARIHNERKEGEISGKKAQQLHKEDHQIRKEERNMAAHDHGHITKGEQKKLNHQENRVSKRIGK